MEPSLIILPCEEQQLNATAKIKENLLDATLLNSNAKRCLRQTLKQCYAINENEKKHHYNQGIMKVEDLSL